jgi:predicted enzyme related to lactoylglutathione lyase
LIQTGYCGYNVIKVDECFVAVRQDHGALHLGDGRLADVKAWPYLIRGDTIFAVNEEIKKRGGDISQYKVFNYKEGVVAANSSLGKVDPTTELIGIRDLPPILFVGRTQEEVLKKVDARSKK